MTNHEMPTPETNRDVLSEEALRVIKQLREIIDNPESKADLVSVAEAYVQKIQEQLERAKSGDEIERAVLKMFLLKSFGK